jgi:hypothetical protein
VKAKSLLALSLVQMLFAVEKQLGLYRRRIRSFSLLIPIMICSVPYLAPEPRSLRACSPKWAMTASDLAVMLKLSNALAEQPQ